MIRRLLDALQTLLRARRIWTIPRDVQVVVFDSALYPVLLPLLGTYRHEVLYLNGTVLYVDPRMWTALLRHTVVTRKLHVGYALAVLGRMRPAIVVTHTDNSPVFQMTARLYRDARFLAIQNGGRLLDRDHPDGSQIYLREFACLGRFEIDQFTRHGATVERFYPVGSLRDAYHREQRAEAGAGTPSRHRGFDLCLVSQLRPGVRTKHAERLDGQDVLAAHVRRFCESHGTTVCVPLRKNPDSDPVVYEWERDYFATRLGGAAHIVPNEPGGFSTYELVDRSRVTIGMHTTVMREGFGRGNRILSCNFSGNPVYDFPVPGPWALNDPAYEVFEERLLWLLNATADDYSAACGDAPSYLIAYDENAPTHVFLRNLIAGAVRGEKEMTSVQ